MGVTYGDLVEHLRSVLGGAVLALLSLAVYLLGTCLLIYLIGVGRLPYRFAGLHLFAFALLAGADWVLVGWRRTRRERPPWTSAWRVIFKSASVLYLATPAVFVAVDLARAPLSP